MTRNATRFDLTTIARITPYRDDGRHGQGEPSKPLLAEQAPNARLGAVLVAMLREALAFEDEWPVDTMEDEAHEPKTKSRSQNHKL